MPYFVNSLGSSLEINEDKFDEAIRLMRKDLGDECGEIDESDTIRCLQVLLRRYDMESSRYDGTKVSLWFDDAKICSHNERFFDFMAPVIADGSIIAFHGDDGFVWRLKYSNGECNEQSIDIYGDYGWK